MMRIRQIGGLIIIALFCACVTEPEESSYDIQELLAAPDSVAIGGQTYSLDTFLWRDFMPVSTPSSSKLIALIWVTEHDSLAIPDGLEASKVFIINDNDLWEATFSDEDRSNTLAYQIEQIARNGPLWDTDILVAVIVELTFENETYLLKAVNQYIGATY